MDNFITLTCPTCGGKLQITNDIERFACGHCGNEHIVKRGGGIVSLAPVAESLNGIKVGVDKTASELAIKRLKEEIPLIWDKNMAIKKQVIERGKQYILYDQRSPLGRALCEIAKARGLTLERGFSKSQVEASFEWFAASKTRLSIKEHDFLIQKILEYDRKFPVSGLNELRNLEMIVEKKEEEIKKHQTIVDIS